MSSNKHRRDNCRQCTSNNDTVTCDGCQQSFCREHASEHRNNLSQQRTKLENDYQAVRQSIDEQKIYGVLKKKIDEWEQQSIEKIRATAKKSRKDLEHLFEERKTESSRSIKQLSDEFDRSRYGNPVTEKDISRLTEQLENLKKNVNNLFGIEIKEQDKSFVCPLTVIKSDEQIKVSVERSTSERTDITKENSGTRNDLNRTISNDPAAVRIPVSVNATGANLSASSSEYLAMTFGFDLRAEKTIERLFSELLLLHPMDKNGPMSGRCERETYQMEQFLTKNFGFRNIPGKTIVQGVKSFQLQTPPHLMNPSTKIYFPSKTSDSFTMTVQEIIDWQGSYRVYAGKDRMDVTERFLKHALQGLTQDGLEAFRMKFVIRISTCPVLMEFDGKIIPRKSDEDWPNRIKLVSVTGIDFAGRKHDVGDIIHYVSNWKEIYEVDHTGEQPALANERDFLRKKHRRRGTLEEDRLLKDLIYMSRLRLLACDQEGVQVVVETGIGLGVFAGEQIGIDKIVRSTTALAIRTVLEDDGPKYKNIRAVVFALPIIDARSDDGSNNDSFREFVHHFEDPPYKGTIPVMIADQDMHRLTVAIARQGFIVSQLNPADSHGVFGEYWQNRGPAVEEKLALTTLGLLVQHHLINPQVLDTKNYFIV